MHLPSELMLLKSVSEDKQEVYKGKRPGYVVVNGDIRSESVLLLKKRKIQKNIKAISRAMVRKYGKSER